MYDPVVSNSGAFNSGLDIHALDDSTHSLLGLSASGLKSLPTSAGAAEAQLDLSLHGKKQVDQAIESSVFNQSQYAGLELLPDAESETIGTLSSQSNDTDSLTTLDKDKQWLGSQEYDPLTGCIKPEKPLHIEGTLKADKFVYDFDTELTIFSGNGNVEFGEGKYDLLDLSSYQSNSLKLNLANINGGGVEYDLGNGERVFDAITLKNGNQILFEGIEQIQFANDDTLDLAVVPNDPLFDEQWNLHMMGVHTAWKFTTGSTDVLMGIQDSGLAVDSDGDIHPDLNKPNTLPGDNYIEDLSENSPDLSHGTAVQGVTSANTDNGYGMSGINWNSDVFHIDVFGGETGDLLLGDATQAMIDQANQKGQRLVINVSLGADGENLSDPKLEQLIAKYQNDVLFVIAAGNDETDESDQIDGLEYPAQLAAKYSNVIAVGAVYGEQDGDENPTVPGTRTAYSNYGEGLTLMGPSEFTTLLGNQTDSSANFGDRLFNGTSASAPSVAGVASLIWSANPNLTADQVKNILAETAYDLGADGYDLETGYGFVNADAAVRRAIALV